MNTPECAQWRPELRGWACPDCLSALHREQEAAAEAQRSLEVNREKARYSALPSPTAQELASHLKGQVALSDGRTHKLGEITYRLLAEALILSLGEGSKGAVWAKPRGYLSMLEADGSLFEYNTSSGVKTFKSSASSYVPLNELPNFSGVTSLAEHEKRARQDRDSKTAAEERLNAQNRRDRQAARLAGALRPFLIVLPATILAAAAIISFRLDLPSKWHGGGSFDVGLTVATIICAPICLLAIFFGGATLAAGIKNRNTGASFIFALVAIALTPAVIGAEFGEPAISQLSILQGVAYSGLGDWLVNVFLGLTQ